MVPSAIARPELGPQAHAEREEVAGWAAGIEAMPARIAARFPRPEPRQRALAYLKGRLSPVERQNGGPVAEQAGDVPPEGRPRLLATYQGDAEPVRDDVRRYVLEHWGPRQAVLVVDETGCLNKGTTSVGVPRPDAGTAGRLENGQLGVVLAYASPTGRPCLDRALYLPPAWAGEAERRREAGVPDEVAFATKPELAPRLLARTAAARGCVPGVTGDEGYGSAPHRRRGLEAQRQPLVLAVRRHELVWISPGATRRHVPVRPMATTIPPRPWQRLRAGDGAKGPRIDDGALTPLGFPVDPGWGRWLLRRRRLSEPPELAYDLVAGPAGPPMMAMVRGAGRRGAMEESVETAQGEGGVDQDAVRRWTGW